MRDIKQIKSLLSRYPSGRLLFIDVGSKDGLEYIRGLEAVTEIHGFEPNLPEFRKLEEKYRQHDFATLTLNATGLSDVNGSSSLYVTQHASMSSLLPVDLPNYQKHFGAYPEFKSWEKAVHLAEKKEIKLQSLDTYFEGRTDTIDFLKIDTQGTELDVLKGAAGLIRNKKISILKLEVSTIPIYHHQVLFSDIDLYLRALGYTLVDFITYRENPLPVLNRYKNHAHFGPCGDAVYILQTANETEEELVKKSLVLCWLGYDSLARHLLSSVKLSAAELKAILSISDLSFKQSVKNSLKHLLPPLLLKLLKKMR